MGTGRGRFFQFFDTRAEGVRLRLNLRATLRGALIVGFVSSQHSVCEFARRHEFYR